MRGMFVRADPLLIDDSSGISRDLRPSGLNRRENSTHVLQCPAGEIVIPYLDRLIFKFISYLENVITRVSSVLFPRAGSDRQHNYSTFRGSQPRSSRS
jgi:hypothetical protein